MKYILITGVSTGIGHAAAKSFLDNGYHVFGSVRKEADAERLQQEFGDHFTPLLFDVTDREAIQATVPQVEAAVGEQGLAGLINNAGIAVGGPMNHIDPEEVRWQMEVNLMGVIHVTQAYLPLLGAVADPPHPPGKIIMISSVAGQVGGPFVGPYVASKHALEGLSHSWRRELIPYGIDVIIVGPGAVQSAIWDKADEIDVDKYAHTAYKGTLIRYLKSFVRDGRKFGLPAANVGDLCRAIIENPRPKTRYAIVPRRIMDWLMPRYMPDRAIDNAFKNQLFNKWGEA